MQSNGSQSCIQYHHDHVDGLNLAPIELPCVHLTCGGSAESSRAYPNGSGDTLFGFLLQIRRSGDGNGNNPSPLPSPLKTSTSTVSSQIIDRLSQPPPSIFQSWLDLQLCNIPDPGALRRQPWLSGLGGINLEVLPEVIHGEDVT